MSSDSTTSKAVEWIVLIILLIIGVNLVPIVVSTVNEAGFISVTENNDSHIIVVSTSNTTTVIYSMRNGSSSYFSVTLNQTDKNGRTTLIYITDFKDTASKTITFTSLNATKTYAVSITYQTSEGWTFTGATAAMTLMGLLPFIFIVGLIIYFLVRLLRS